MFDNRVFDQAMEASRAAAERGDWETALDAAETAIAARPDDVDACSELAVALYHNAQYARAIMVLEDSHTRYPDDLLILAYLARSYEGDNQHANAVTTLLKLGEQASTQQLLDDALEAFEEAVRLAPTDERARISLAEILVALGERLRAAEQCMVVAQQRHATGDTAGAREALDEALILDPGHLQARRLQVELNRSAANQSSMLDGGDIRQTSVPDATRIAQLATQALAHQRAGEITTALRLYQAALAAGAEQPDVWYNLALLHIEQGEDSAAIKLLQKAINSPEYAVKAATALGNALRTSGDVQAAIDIYTGTIAQIDGNAINRADANDVIELYGAAANAYAELGDVAGASALCDTLATMLHHKRWGQDLAEQQRARAKQFTQHSVSSRSQQLNPQQSVPETAWGTLSTSETLRDTSALGQDATNSFAALQLGGLNNQYVLAPVTPLDTTGCSEVVTSLIEASEQFIEQGLVWAALDACHEVIRLDAQYLPIHLRLSEIYERQGHVNDALAKYRTLIDTYTARECAADAIGVYERMIDLAPDDLDTRMQLVAVLRDAGRIDAATTEAITIANTAFRTGRTSRAIEAFEDIHTWATPSATLHIEHGRALLKLEHWTEAAAQWKQAAERDEHNLLPLALHVLAMALVEPPSAMLWNTFATLLHKLAGDETQLGAVQGEYRLALLLVDSPVLHLLLGLLQQTAQQHDLALMSFEQALSSLPMDEQGELAPLLVHQAMVRSYLAQEDRHSALEQLHMVQRLLQEQPVPPTSQHAFARPLTPAEVQRMIEALTSDAHNAAEPTGTLGVTTEVPTEATPDAGAASAPPSLPQRRPNHINAAPTDTAAQNCAERTPAYTGNGDALAAIAAAEAAAQRLAQAGRDDEALTALYRAAMDAWMLGQHNEAARLIQLGIAWVPQQLRAWQQQVHLFLLIGDKERAAAAQREIMQLALTSHPHALHGSVQQVLVLVPDDTRAKSLRANKQRHRGSTSERTTR